tara:strand:+ start:325 stop:726 length:402 start_codon:yes stop_codon:yes gene_type:complete
LNNDILDLIGKRLIKGERKYGHENVACDGRDFTEEALEEALDCAVYLAARIVEIQNKKERHMGRAIDQNKTLGDHERRLKLLEDALEEMIQTRVHHVDLVEDVKPLGVEVAPDEEFRAPLTVKRKRKKAEATT